MDRTSFILFIVGFVFTVCASVIGTIYNPLWYFAINILGGLTIFAFVRFRKRLKV